VTRALALALAGAALLLAPTSVGAVHETAEASLSRLLFVNGDSLAVGTRPYLPRALRRWRVTQSVSISRHAPEGASVLRAYGRGLPRVTT
jgi:hypothetical protein